MARAPARADHVHRKRHRPPPTAFGDLKQHTGSITGGLYALAIAFLVAAVAALFARTHRRTDPPRGLPADESFTHTAMLRHAEH